MSIDLSFYLSDTESNLHWGYFGLVVLVVLNCHEVKTVPCKLGVYSMMFYPLDQFIDCTVIHAHLNIFLIMILMMMIVFFSLVPTI